MDARVVIRSLRSDVIASLLCALLVGSPALDEAPRLTVGTGNGVTLRTADGTYEVGVRARLVLRTTAHLDDEDGTPVGDFDVGIRALRVTTWGSAWHQQLRWNLQLGLSAADLDPALPVPVFDAWMELVAHDDVRLRVGQFFVPLDRARTLRESTLLIADRAAVIGELNLDRDIGAMLVSDDAFGAQGRISFALGAFGGAGRNHFLPHNGSPLLVGRLVFKPMGAFDDDVQGDSRRVDRVRLALGIGSALQLRARHTRGTTGAEYAVGPMDHVHAAVDGVVKWRGMSLLGEVVGRTALQDTPWQEAAWQGGDTDTGVVGVVDGETVVQHGRDAVGLLWEGSALVSSSVELVGRYGHFFVLNHADDTFATAIRDEDNEAGFGCNVLLRGSSARLQGDVGVRFADPRATDASSSTTSEAHPPSYVTRLQLDVTF